MSKWHKVRIDQAAEVVSGGTPSRDNPSFWGAGTPWATPTDITRCATAILSETSESITDLGLASSSAKRLPIGTILLTSRATIGAARIAGIEICTNQGFKNLVPKPGFDPTFLYYQVCRLRSQFERFGVGSTFAEINKRDVSQVEFDCSEAEEEQEKIGRVLRLTDDQIEQTEALIAKQERIRAGLLQDLFTRGVDQNGALRPPRGEAPDLYHETELGWLPKGWSAPTLREACSLIRDGTHLPPPRVPNGPLLLSVRNMIDGELVALPDDTRVSQKFFDQMHSKWRIEAGDVLLAIVGATLGKTCQVPEELPTFTLQRSVAVIRGTTPALRNDFLLWYLRGPMFQRLLWQQANQTAQPGVYLDQVGKMRTPMPNPDEQASIASILMASRNSHQEGARELTKLRALKSALMQDLLTGRVSVAPLLQSHAA